MKLTGGSSEICRMGISYCRHLWALGFDTAALSRACRVTDLSAITHPEYYYGFAITGVAWQVAFLVISYDPQRFRTLMPVTWLEKSWGLIAFVLYLENRISLQMLALGLIDLLFAAFFVSAYITTTKSRVRVIGGPDGPATRVPGRAGQR